MRFSPAVTLNPTTLLPDTQEETPHDCQQILAEVHGTSYLLEGQRKAGAAVVDGTEVVWASALPPGTSAQRAELIALTQALKEAEGKKANIYTDS